MRLSVSRMRSSLIMLNNHHLYKLMANQISFAIYRLPDTQQFKLVLQTSGLPISHHHYRTLNSGHGFVIAPFVQKTQSPCVIIQPDITAKGITDINQRLADFCHTLPDNKHIELPQPMTHAPDYNQTFDRFYDALTENTVDKIVLSQPDIIKKPVHFSLTQTFDRLCQRYPSCYNSLCYTPQSGLWLGASPELLVSGYQKTWQTVSLAGTQRASCAIAWNEKNTVEQQIVTDYIQQQLDTLNITYSVNAPYTVQAGPLIHLRSDLDFTLQTHGIGDVIEQLHPTPAVCGFPKQTAYHFIQQHEGYSRGYYSGFIGFLSPNETSHLYVNLRCMQIHNEALTLYAGAGLLPSSDKYDEQQEIASKLEIMQTILA